MARKIVFKSRLGGLALRQTMFAGIRLVVTRTLMLLMTHAACNRSKEALVMEGGILDRADRFAGQNRLAAVLTNWPTGILVKDVTPAAVAIVDVVDVE